MQASGHGGRDDFIVVRREDGGELADAFGVAALGETDEELAADAQNVAALQRAGKGDVLELAKFGDGLRKRHGFRAARFGAQGKDDSEFVEDDGGIFDEHGIGKIRRGGERDDMSAEFFEKLFVGVMLGLRGLEIDWLARDEAQLAIYDSGTDGASDGSLHRARASLHEKFAKD